MIHLQFCSFVSLEVLLLVVLSLLRIVCTRCVALAMPCPSQTHLQCASSSTLQRLWKSCVKCFPLPVHIRLPRQTIHTDILISLTLDFTSNSGITPRSPVWAKVGRGLVVKVSTGLKLRPKYHPPHPVIHTLTAFSAPVGTSPLTRVFTALEKNLRGIVLHLPSLAVLTPEKWDEKVASAEHAGCMTWQTCDWNAEFGVWSDPCQPRRQNTDLKTFPESVSVVGCQY